MNLDIQKTISIIKSALLTLFTFSIIYILNAYAFFLGIKSTGNDIPQMISYIITISLLIGYIIETTHLFISNNCEKIEPSIRGFNILKYFKYTLYFILIFTIFNLILHFASLMPIEILSNVSQLIILFILSFVIPCGIIIYAKNL